MKQNETSKDTFKFVFLCETSKLAQRQLRAQTEIKTKSLVATQIMQ